MMVSFVLSFFPRDVLDEILNLIESVSEDFPSYSYNPTDIIRFVDENMYGNTLLSTLKRPEKKLVFKTFATCYIQYCAGCLLYFVFASSLTEL